jgi:hypothetical protein
MSISGSKGKLILYFSAPDGVLIPPGSYFELPTGILFSGSEVFTGFVEMMYKDKDMVTDLVSAEPIYFVRERILKEFIVRVVNNNETTYLIPEGVAICALHFFDIGGLEEVGV